MVPFILGHGGNGPVRGAKRLSRGKGYPGHAYEPIVLAIHRALLIKVAVPGGLTTVGG